MKEESNVAGPEGISPSIVFCLVLTLVVGFLVGFYSVYYSGRPKHTGLILFSEKAEKEKEEAQDDSPPRGGEYALEVMAVSERGKEAILTDFRLTRDKERSRLQERLEELLISTDQDISKNIQSRLVELSVRSHKEKEVESLLVARGYAQTAVMLYDHGVTVLVKGMSLDAGVVAQIGELVARIIGYPLDQIRILE